MKFAVCVTFKIYPGHWNEFVEVMRQNASMSKILESGCEYFDVCMDEQYPFEVFLYEIYSSPEAFDLHLNSPHFIAFDAKVSDMIEEKNVRTYQMVS